MLVNVSTGSALLLPASSPNAAGRVQAPKAAARVPLALGLLLHFFSPLNVKGRAPMQTCNHLLGLVLPIHWVMFILPGNCCPSTLRKTASCRSGACQLPFVAWRDAGAGKAAPMGGGGAGHSPGSRRAP